MKKLGILAFIMGFSAQLYAQRQDDRLYSYVLEEIEKTRSKFFKRDSLLKSNYEAPDVSRFTPYISVNNKSVDLEFLKLISISDTLSVNNKGEKIGYSANSRPVRIVALNGMVSVEMDKKKFRELWKIHKSSYIRK